MDFHFMLIQCRIEVIVLQLIYGNQSFQTSIMVAAIEALILHVSYPSLSSEFSIFGRWIIFAIIMELSPSMNMIVFLVKTFVEMLSYYLCQCADLMHIWFCMGSESLKLLYWFCCAITTFCALNLHKKSLSDIVSPVRLHNANIPKTVENNYKLG